MIKYLKAITKREWFFVIFLSLVVIIITTGPFIYGWLASGDRFFTGIHFVSANDWSVYYSFINQGKDGSFLFRDLFAPMVQVPVFRPDWLLIGIFARLFDLSEKVAFQLARISLIPIFFAMSYLFLAYFFTDQKQRKFGLVFLAFSSGVGTFLLHRLAQIPSNYLNGAFQWPMDLWVTDINTFYTLFTSPHFISATILLLLIFFLALIFVEDRNYCYPVLAGFCGLLLFLIHPFQILKVFLIIGFFFSFLIIRAKKIIWPLVFNYLIFSLLSAPAILYYFWLMKNDSLTNLRALQNINPTTPIYLTAISFGGLLVFAILGIYFLAKEKKIWENKYLFVVTWLVLQLVLLYAPISYQRRMVLGVHFPLVILTLICFFYIYQNHLEFIKKWLILIIVFGFLVFLPSSFFVLAADIMVYSQSRGISYLERDVYDSFLWLKDNTDKGSIIFAEVGTGNILPAYSLRTSYIGHAVESPYYRQRKLEPDWFFKMNRNQEIESRFLAERKINYLFYSPSEKALGDYSPKDKLYLTEVYSNPLVSIYKVNNIQ